MNFAARFTLVSTLTLMISACSGADISHNLGSVKDSLFSVGSIFTPSVSESYKASLEPEQKNADDVQGDTGNENAVLECPRIEYIEELSIVDKYVDNNAPHPDGLEYTANIAHFESSCRVLPDENKADIEIYIRFYAELGDAGRFKPNEPVSVSHPYFIATLDKDNNIINKQVETLSMAYEPQENQISKLEKIKYVMPYDATQNPKDYRVVMGFILTKSQIKNNRRDYQF